MVPLYSHFLEIRLRFFYILLSLLLTSVTSYYYQLEILYLIGRPFLELDHKFILIDLTEAFYTLLKMCAIVSFFFVIPFCMYHFWSFYIPSRYNFERKILTLFCFVFFGLLLIEIMILYIIIFPRICEFLLSFEIISSAHKLPLNSQWNNTWLEFDRIDGMPNLQFGTDWNLLINDQKSTHNALSENRETAPVLLELTARLESYVKLTTHFYFTMLILFQLPFFILIFYYYNLIDCYSLCRSRKIFLFSSVLLSAFISPPDILSQSILAILFFFFYELLIFVGVFNSILQNKKKTTFL